MQNLELAYLGLGVRDVPRWSAFATGIAGLELGGTGAAGEQRLRNDDKAWRISLHPMPDDDIVYAGFSAPDAAGVRRIGQALSEQGFQSRPMTGEESQARQVDGGIVCEDPDGLRIEIVQGQAGALDAFRSPTGARFVTDEVGLGHVVVSTSDVETSLRFYQALGFELSDYIEVPLGGHPTRLVFLHCNARHHTLALLPAPTPKRLNHLMLECTSVDAVLAAYNRALTERLPVVRNLGRHTNDEMLSFYVATPAGFDLEYGWGGRTIGGEWEVTTYNAISHWGHEQPA